MSSTKNIKINVTFTGICVFVEHQGGATVVIPNVRAIKGVTYGGAHAHVPSHLPFLEYKEGQAGLIVPPPLILFSHQYAGHQFYVVELGTSVSGVTLAFCEKDGGTFTPKVAALDWNNVVEMDRVVGPGYPIDDSLVSGYDPRSDRVSVRVPISYGYIEPVQQYDVYASFYPVLDRPYSGCFVQEVRWKLTYEGGLHCQLRAQPLGTTGKGDLIVDFNGYAGEVFDITIGNAPIEDIIRLGMGPREIVDHHFSTYYDLLNAQPSAMRLPHRTSEKKHGSRTGASNCPPAKLSLR